MISDSAAVIIETPLHDSRKKLIEIKEIFNLNPLCSSLLVSWYALGDVPVDRYQYCNTRIHTGPDDPAIT